MPLTDWVKSFCGSYGGADGATTEAQVRDLVLDEVATYTVPVALGAAVDIAISPFWKNPYTVSVQVLACVYHPSAALVAHAANHRDLTVTQGVGAGASATVVATRLTDTVPADDMAACVDWPLVLGAAANLIVPSGSELSISSATPGAGVALPAGTLTVWLRKI